MARAATPLNVTYEQVEVYSIHGTFSIRYSCAITVIFHLHPTTLDMQPSLWAALAAGFGAILARAVPLTQDPEEPRRLHARNLVDSIADSYDFVIVGGGLAGLVLGARLSEDANHTVLVLEAGGTGDDVRERIGVHPPYQRAKPTQ